MSRTLVRYTIPLDSEGRGTHRLGVNSLVIDPTRSGTLYSGGRDGIIAAWDLKMDLSKAPSKYDEERNEVQVNDIRGSAAHYRGIQAHTNWVNQIALSSDYQTIYSCSSDTFIKSWRPNAAQTSERPESLGSHGDYVKCLVTSRSADEWVATAGLDRSILFWDTSGKGERMRIDQNSKDGGMKQSIYSLATGPNLIVSGGIEKVIRVWDTRSGNRSAKFVGHTDNVRSLMCSEDGKYFISASSDSTIKVWDLTAGRCLHTMTTHSDPVWTLLSDHPQLAVFHAADKSGMLTKTDLRPRATGKNIPETVAICRESSGINSLAQIGSHLFTATASSSINRWADFESPPTDPFADESEVPLYRIESTRSNRSEHLLQRHSSTHQHKRPSKFMLGKLAKPTTGQSSLGSESASEASRRVSLWSHASVVSLAPEDNLINGVNVEALEPINSVPESTILGQAGLQAHILLSDRRRVLTRDSDGQVKLWDITQCKQISDFGRVDINEVESKLQSHIAVGSWCSLNTRVGALTVELDPRNLLDAEVYFDSFSTSQNLDFDTKNQRFNLGKWMLQGLFKGVVEAQKATEASDARRIKARKPTHLNLGNLSITTAQLDGGGGETPRAVSATFGSRNPYSSAMSTPGASFGLTTPAPTYNPKPNGTGHQSQNSLSSLGSSKDSVSSPTVGGDYFSSPHGTRDPDATPMGTDLQSPGSLPKTPGGSNLMKNMKWLRSSKTNKSTVADAKKGSVPATPAATTPESQLPPGVKTQTIPKNYKEFIAQQRKAFQEANKGQDQNGKKSTWIQPPEALPELQIPPNVGLSLAIFQPGEGEAKDIYRGEVGTIGNDLDTISDLLPVWLAQILLSNETPPELQNIESNKHYFSFVPHGGSKLQDPFNTTPSTLMRLGAARSLRIRKALTYISQRLPPELVEREGQGKREEEWLEIIVAGKPVDPDWTLLMTRRHLWKQGGDMKLEYKLRRE
ncbi:WD repeat protein [Taphrina deformans PYCC 5710]|uniref:WD repeat protein n=1 Tax=Taphrina deformans (strain PYCC 5710 / ATCC 11124 / CBS 356.35 / IMI 108563 / JCM 9778 / NBRC 8474) TaxID=1097556 RepID=R4XAU3_TAPDE|nr:WD repeat protein [Taphrina deformans PYCC 5710]|eukprot:CCG82659.1 WD repeat protein [Taphrina deformans PYCC 5710]